MKKFLALAIPLLLTGCRPEVAPYSLAPRCPSYEWMPGCCPAKLEESVECELAQGICTVEPEAGDEVDLAMLLCLAMQNSPDTRETWADARIAAAQYGASRAAYYPDVDGQPFFTALREGEFFGTGMVREQEFYKYGPTLGMSYLLLDFGARAAHSRMFCETLARANWTHNRQIQTVLQTVATDYYSYVAAKEQVDAAIANVENARVNLEATEAKNRAGVSDLSDVLQAKSQLAQQELQLLTDGETLVQSLTQLSNDAGLPSNLPLQIKGLPKEIPVEQLLCSVEDLVSQAYHCRPDLVAALADVRAQRARLAEACANRLPQLNFNGTVGTTFFDEGENDKYNYQAGFTLQVPIFKGWWYRNRIKEARADIDRSRAKLRKLQLSISQDVVTYYQQFMIATDKVKTGEAYVEAATGSYRSALQKYKVGTTDFTTLFTAQATLADARAALVNARQDWYTSLTDLGYSVGELTPPTDCRNQFCKLEGR